MRANFKILEDEPTQEEIEEHNIDHAKYRSWCPHGVKGKPKALPHANNKEFKIREVPQLSMDYAFMNDDKKKEEEEIFVAPTPEPAAAETDDAAMKFSIDDDDDDDEEVAFAPTPVPAPVAVTSDEAK